MRRVIAGLAVVALAGVAVAASGFFGYRSGGPFGGWNAAGVAWPAGPGETVTWAMPLPDNAATTDIVIDSISPVGVDGLEVLDVLVSTDGCAAVPTLSTAFPPLDVSTRDPQGARLVGLSKPCDLHVLVSVRRSLAPAPGRIQGLRIRYEFAGSRYEDVLPYSLELREPEGDGSLVGHGPATSWASATSQMPAWTGACAFAARSASSAALMSG